MAVTYKGEPWPPWVDQSGTANDVWKRTDTSGVTTNPDGLFYVLPMGGTERCEAAPEAPAVKRAKQLRVSRGEQHKPARSRKSRSQRWR